MERTGKAKSYKRKIIKINEVMVIFVIRRLFSKMMAKLSKWKQMQMKLSIK